LRIDNPAYVLIPDQIIAPHDVGISDAIQSHLAEWDDVDRSSICVDSTDQVTQAYFTTLKETVQAFTFGDWGKAHFLDPTGSCSSLSADMVNTSLHGVSNPFIVKAFAALGFRSPVPVQSQMDPDPDFPTVNFPNPEEAGV
jgi:phosphoglucomutase